MKNFGLLLSFILALAVQAFADSTVDYISLNGPGGSFTTTWDGQPGTNIGGATNLFGSTPEWSFDIYANNDAGVFSNFVGGTFSFVNANHTWSIFADLTSISFDPITGVLTGAFRSEFPQPLPGESEAGFLSGTLHEQLNMTTDTFGGGYLTNVTSTVPEPGNLALMGTGLCAIISVVRRRRRTS